MPCSRVGAEARLHARRNSRRVVYTDCQSGSLELISPFLAPLQGLLTNDVSPLDQPGAPPFYACILTPLGRYAHDLLLFRSQGGAKLSRAVRAQCPAARAAPPAAAAACDGRRVAGN